MVHDLIQVECGRKRCTANRFYVLCNVSVLASRGEMSSLFFIHQKNEHPEFKLFYASQIIIFTGQRCQGENAASYMCSCSFKNRTSSLRGRHKRIKEKEMVDLSIVKDERVLTFRASPFAESREMGKQEIKKANFMPPLGLFLFDIPG